MTSRHHSRSRNGEETDVRVIGDVVVSDHAALTIPKDGRVEVEIRSKHGGRIRIVWDASDCTVYRNGKADACTSADRKLAVASIEQLPEPPVPPQPPDPQGK